MRGAIPFILFFNLDQIPDYRHTWNLGHISLSAGCVFQVSCSGKGPPGPDEVTGILIIDVS
ncbi:MAG: hypothetical protein K8R17_06410 [Methanosarcinales archaeon]|nr:hypothetical protein [Methanosarcinales archaeon]